VKIFSVSTRMTKRDKNHFKIYSIMHTCFYITKKTIYRCFTIPGSILTCIFFLTVGTNVPVSGQEAALSGIRASVSGTLNCMNPSVKLIGSSGNENMVYRWEGPNGYIATAKESITTIPGNYTLVVVDPATGKTATSGIIVRFDTTAPAGVTAEVTGDITCRDTLVTLKGKSSTTGVVYFWEGPHGFSSKEKEPITSVPGFYRLAVTNPVNGCSSVANVNIKKNTEKPKEISATVSGTLTCKTKSVTLKATSSTGKVAYDWSGPDFTAESAQVNVVAPGEYKVTVTNPVNGCSSEVKVIVEQDTDPPENVIVTNPDTLNCMKNIVIVKASSGSGAMIYAWEGPKHFSSDEASFETCIPGSYTLTVTNPANGCSTKRKVQVVQDTVFPDDVTLITSGTLTCKTKMITLSGKSNLPGLTYDWSGPDNFISKFLIPEVNVPGKYQATITNTRNGCSTTKSIIVSQDTLAPTVISAKASDTLNCSVKEVKLIGFSGTKDVIFKWTGPQDFSMTGQTVTTSYPGRYILIVKNPLNGCISEVSTNVIEKECAD
jgi:hypothetical protein